MPNNLITPRNDFKLHLVVRLLFWVAKEYGIPFHYHYSQLRSNLEWKYVLGSNLWVK